MTSGKELGNMLKKLFGLPVDDVISLSPEDYEHAISEVIEIARSIKAKSVFTYGTVSDPGISDLDILIVSETPFPFKKLSKRTRWIMSHTPIVITSKDIKHINRYLDTRKLKLVWGKSIHIPAPSDEDLQKIAIEQMIWKTMGFHSKLITRRLRARDLLLSLNSLKYSFMIIGKNHSEFFQEVIELRKGWFKYDRQFKLPKLLELTYRSFWIIEEFFKSFGRKYAQSRKMLNWIWSEGEAEIPKPSGSLPFGGRLSEVIYFFNIYKARIPGKALEYVKDYPAKGWRGAIIRFRNYLTKSA